MTKQLTSIKNYLRATTFPAGLYDVVYSCNQLTIDYAVLNILRVKSCFENLVNSFTKSGGKIIVQPEIKVWATLEVMRHFPRLQNILDEHELIYACTDSGACFAEGQEIWKKLVEFVPNDDCLFASYLPVDLVDLFTLSYGFSDLLSLSQWERVIDSVEKFIQDDGTDRTYFLPIGYDDPPEGWEETGSCLNQVYVID